VSQSNSWFDRFADRAADFVASPLFFFACCLLVILWVPSIFLGLSVDTWQLIINTATTIITFLMVAVLQNDQHRFEAATNGRLQEVIDKLEGAVDPVEDEGQKA
jgi:low affinity Fe/Cu permease